MTEPTPAGASHSMTTGLVEGRPPQPGDRIRLGGRGAYYDIEIIRVVKASGPDQWEIEVKPI